MQGVTVRKRGRDEKRAGYAKEFDRWLANYQQEGAQLSINVYISMIIVASQRVTTSPADCNAAMILFTLSPLAISLAVIIFAL